MTYNEQIQFIKQTANIITKPVNRCEHQLRQAYYLDQLLSNPLLIKRQNLLLGTILDICKDTSKQQDSLASFYAFGFLVKAEEKIKSHSDNGVEIDQLLRLQAMDDFANEVVSETGYTPELAVQAGEFHEERGLKLRQYAWACV